MLIFNSTRFGRLECVQSEIISFRQGIPGFETATAFVMIDHPGTEPFLWLQSLKYPDLAFPMLETSWYGLDYRISIPPELASLLRRELLVKEFHECAIYGVVTIPADHPKMTMNLRAPILINGSAGVGMQFILPEEGNPYAIREPLYQRMKSAMMGGFRRGEKIPTPAESIVVIRK